ncbi:MAG: DUF2461 domain-containing protein [Tenuifilaceae bacterium]|jgi:uncharacterized protein (TIGR02453 family)|nr:DUF2461 domain-containing protein [Tenuifilaceae bacterium]
MSFIHKKTVEFLVDLKDNNNREWFNTNRERYDFALQNFKEFTDKLILSIASFDKSIASLEAKDCIFRIYRDVRFARDKNPYKTNMGAYIARGGRKSPFAGYYFHLEPEESFVSGGIYMAPNPILKKIREDIDYYHEEFRGIVESEVFQKTFTSIGSESLKRVPAGFSSDSPVAKYLMLKHITPSRPLKSNEILDSNLIERISANYKVMLPLIAFINRSIETED